MTTSAITNEEIVQLFCIRLSLTTNVWESQDGTTRTQNITGFSNLMQPFDCKQYVEERASWCLRCLSKLFYCLVVLTIHGWLCSVMRCFLHFSVVNDSDVCTHTRYNGISMDTFKNHLTAIATHNKHNICTTLSDRFVFVFDKQTTPEAHYVAVFATYPLENSVGCHSACLAMSPLENETTHDADKHSRILNFELSVFGKDASNVATLIGNNCNVNRSISTKTGVQLKGCASHLLPTCCTKSVLMKTRMWLLKLCTWWSCWGRHSFPQSCEGKQIRKLSWSAIREGAQLIKHCWVTWRWGSMSWIWTRWKPTRFFWVRHHKNR